MYRFHKNVIVGNYRSLLKFIKIKVLYYCRVEVPLEHLANSVSDVKVENDVDVPLPTDQVS